MKHFIRRIKSRRLLLLSLLEKDYDESPTLVEWTPDGFGEDSYPQHFRFTKAEIVELVLLLKIPPKVILDNGAVVDSFTALCILLKRFAYPCRLIDLQHFFGISSHKLSRIINYMIEHMYKFQELLVWDVRRLTSEKLQEFSKAIFNRGSPIDCCIGFIDGTLRPICRPTKYQKSTYNGHKSTHGLKFQSVNTPDGIITHFSGPYEGQRHDVRMLVESNLLPILQESLQVDGKTYVIYGDPAYGMRKNIVAPFKGTQLNDQQQLFNKRMSSVRVSVEWCFGGVVSNWSFVDFKKNLKIYLQPIGKYYIVAVLL